MRRVAAVLSSVTLLTATVVAAVVSVRAEQDVAPGGAGAPLRSEEVVVEAERPQSAASSVEIPAEEIALRPHATTQEVLNDAPGLVAAQHQGGGKATQYLIRGFDADHGTDFAVFVDDLPVNLPTHAHGQGYADLNFLIPDLIAKLRYRKGVYAAEDSDFATTGSARIDYQRDSSRRGEQNLLWEAAFRRTWVKAFPRVCVLLGFSPKAHSPQ